MSSPNSCACSKAHELLTTARMSHILDYAPSPYGGQPTTGRCRETPQANAEIRQVAGEAHAQVVGSRLLDPGV